MGCHLAAAVVAVAVAAEQPAVVPIQCAGQSPISDGKPGNTVSWTSQLAVPLALSIAQSIPRASSAQLQM